MSRNDWLMAGLLILIGSAAGIAFAWALPTLALPAGGVVLVGVALGAVALYLRRRQRRARRVEAVANVGESEWKSLWQAGLEVSAAQNYGAVLRTVVDRARDLLQGDASALCLLDDQKRWWVVQGASGASDAFQVDVKPFSRNGATTYACPLVRFKYREAHLDAPIMRGDRVLGCLCIANSRGRAFSAREHELLQGIADQAAVAIDHARNFEIEGARAATEERERLAREMHDTLAQLLGFVGLKSQSARELLEQGETAAAQKQLDQLTSLAQELYADTRELILGLKTEITPDRALVRALEVYAEWFSELSGVKTAITQENFGDVRLPPAVEVQLIRVAQEALSNVRKHARATTARVHFAREGDWARLSVEDNGIGFDASNPPRGTTPRFGLSSMRERVESVGGKIAIESSAVRGTRIEIRVPLIYRGGA